MSNVAAYQRIFVLHGAVVLNAKFTCIIVDSQIVVRNKKHDIKPNLHSNTVLAINLPYTQQDLKNPEMEGRNSSSKIMKKEQFSMGLSPDKASILLGKRK